MNAQRTGWTGAVLLVGLLVLSGCGPSKEQQAIDAVNRGFAHHFEQGELDKAIADYTQAIRLDPNLAMAYNNRGLVYVVKGELDKAIADYTEVIRLNPKDAESYNSRGLVYGRDKGDFDKAIADYDEAIRLDPTDAVTYANRGWVYAQKGEKAKAEADFAKAKELGYEPE